MKHAALSLASLTFALLATACSEVTQEAHFNRGSPESLLDLSSEVVSVSLNDSASADELIGWINQEQPSKAELNCVESDPVCARAREVLQQFNVPFEVTGAVGNTVALHYERVMVRDCENRYIDNSINPYNLNHPTLGCSIAANMVQQVTDKRQFVNPSLLEFTDGDKAAQVVKSYREKKEGDDSDSDETTSLLNGSSTSR